MKQQNNSTSEVISLRAWRQKSRSSGGDTAEGDAYYVSVPDPWKLPPRMPFLAEGRSSKLSRHMPWNIQRPGHLIAVFWQHAFNGAQLRRSESETVYNKVATEAIGHTHTPQMERKHMTDRFGSKWLQQDTNEDMPGLRPFSFCGKLVAREMLSCDGDLFSGRGRAIWPLCWGCPPLPADFWNLQSSHAPLRSGNGFFGLGGEREQWWLFGGGMQ